MLPAAVPRYAPWAALLVGAAVLGAGAVLVLHRLGGDGGYRAAISEVRPAVDQVTVTVDGDPAMVTLRSSSTRTVIVQGYGQEPYLRFTPSGVDENTASLTSAVNTRGALTSASAPNGDARKAAARWTHRSNTPEFTWPDLRVRWTSAQQPPAVLEDPGAAHDLGTWGLPLTVDGAPAVVLGSLRWEPAPGPWRWVLVAVLLVAVATAARWAWLRRRGSGSKPASRGPLTRPLPRTVTLPTARPAATPPRLSAIPSGSRSGAARGEGVDAREQR